MPSWIIRRVWGMMVIEWLLFFVGLAVAFYIISRPISRFPRAYYEGKDHFYWLGLLLENDPRNDQQAVAALCHMLLDEEYEQQSQIRSMIVGGLGSAGPRATAAIPTLETMLEHEQDPKLRKQVREALHRIAPNQFPTPAPESSRSSWPADGSVQECSAFADAVIGAM